MMLVYKPHARVEDLAVGDCTVHRAAKSPAERWWLLWFYVARETDGVPEDFCVPVNPGGPAIESGPGGRTWGLTKTAAGVWQVSPSINIQVSRVALMGPAGPSLWHQTPQIVGVPDDEPWATGRAP